MNPTVETRRRQLAAAQRRIADCVPGEASAAIFRLRALAAAEELGVRLATGASGDLGAEVLWTLVDLAPAILDPPPGPGLAAELYPHPELLDARETAQRLRAAVAAFAAEGPAAPRAAAWCRFLGLMFETVEQLTRFGHPGGRAEVVDECSEVLGAGAAFLESTIEAGR